MTDEGLRKWRKERGLTQTDLSEILSSVEGEVPQSRISEYERGVRPIPRWMAHELNSVVFGDGRDRLPKLKTRKVTWGTR